MPLIDLHVHTTASDGSMTPGEVTRLAARSGVSALGITDHDEVAGNIEAMQTGEELRVEVVPGVELSAELGPGTNAHILGYYVGIENAALNGALEELRGARETRNKKIINNLRKLGISITYDKVLEQARGRAVGRPHIAQALVAIKAVSSFDAAFKRYLRRGSPAYEERMRLEPRKALELIRKAGGITVLAHPRHLNMGKESLEQLVVNLKDSGLQGIEAFYPDHSPRDTELYIDLARKFDLLLTGGTDFHGSIKPDIRLALGQGDFKVPYEVLENLRSRRNEKSWN